MEKKFGRRREENFTVGQGRTVVEERSEERGTGFAESRSASGHFTNAILISNISTCQATFEETTQQELSKTFCNFRRRKQEHGS